jgi:hypothetical protein
MIQERVRNAAFQTLGITAHALNTCLSVARLVLSMAHMVIHVRYQLGIKVLMNVWTKTIVPVTGIEGG